MVESLWKYSQSLGKQLPGIAAKCLVRVVQPARASTSMKSPATGLLFIGFLSVPGCSTEANERNAKVVADGGGGRDARTSAPSVCTLADGICSSSDPQVLCCPQSGHPYNFAKACFENSVETVYCAEERSGLPRCGSPQALGGPMCSDSSAGVGDSGPMFRNALLVSPNDLATGVDALVRPNVKVSGGFPGAPLPPGWPPALDLRDGSSGAQVKVVTVEDGGAASEEVVPDAALPEGWYVFTVHGWTGGLAGVDPLQGRGPTKLPGGDYGVRFRVGSQPLLLVAGICASTSTDLLPKVVLRFSEPVKSTSALPIRVVANGRQATCTLNGGLSAPADFIELVCDPPISGTAAVTIEIAEGLLSTSNIPVRDVTGVTSMTLSIPALRDNDVCRLWLETRAPVTQTLRDAGPG